MTVAKRPDPLRDELTDEAKEELAILFAALKRFYSTSHHKNWRSHERLWNASSNQRFYLEHERDFT